MVYAKWAALVPLSFLMEIVGKIGSPVLALFVDENGWLPSWLWWFQTPDNSCDGDAGHRERWPRDGVFWTWARRAAWLFRNSAYGFNYYVVGVRYEEGDLHWHEGDPSVGDTSGVSGLCRWYLERDGELIGFQIYYVKHYRIFCTWKCVRIGAGWKMWGDVEKDPYCPHWVYFNPVKGSGLEEKEKE